MNDVLKALCERRSVRSFSKERVPEDLIESLVRAALHAPSGENQQSAHIVIAQSAEAIGRLSHLNSRILAREGCVDEDPYYSAPLVLLVLSDGSSVTPVEDGCLALGNVMLAAHSLGLGSCWIHRAREMFEMEDGKALLHELGLDAQHTGIGACAIGYPAGPTPHAAPRRAGRVLHLA